MINIELKENQIYNIDCLEGFKYIDNNSIDLIIIDPPYNIKKDKWDNIENYIEWMGDVFKECERVLKYNGSFYWFHNDMLKIKDLMKWLESNTEFVFKQFIVWNKRFKESKNKGYLDGYVEMNNIRNYQQMAEYILFYTLQDEFKSCEFFKTRQYILNEINKAFQNGRELNKYLGFAENGGMASRKYMGKTQWYLPTKKHYEKLQKTGYFQKSYDELVKQYKEERYTFNNQKTHHSVWNYEIAPKIGHITPKPVALMECLIKTYTNEDDLILDFTCGSGTTLVAAKNLNRRVIGIELEEEYCKVAKERLSNY